LLHVETKMHRITALHWRNIDQQTGIWQLTFLFLSVSLSYLRRCWKNFITLMTEAVHTSVTLVYFYKTTWHHIP
jgi:hypothetical protein